MKKRLLFTVILINLALVFSLNAQTQPENASFENWEDVGLTVQEPVDWSSIKTSDNTVTNPLAPVVWGQSTEAHTGSFSLHLFNVETIGSIVAAGTVTNGRVHADFNPDLAYVFTDIADPKWNTPCTDKPDSIVVWIKYFPEQNDVGTIRAVLHKGAAQAPDLNETNWIALAEFDYNGTGDVWTRFSAPFSYINNDNPEYILINMYSGNGTTPVKGSYAYVDDVALIYNGIGIDERTLSDISIYTQDNIVFVNWQAKSVTKNAEIKILDLSGRAVWSGNISNNQSKRIQLDAPKGVYVCHITSGNKAFTQKLIMP